MDAAYQTALETLSRRGASLSATFGYVWTPSVQEAVHRRRFDARRVAATAVNSPSVQTRPLPEAPTVSTPAVNVPPDPASPLVLAAIVGGASAGKSTVFNNLLAGRVDRDSGGGSIPTVSRVAAWGHTTLGPILAIHRRHEERVGQDLEQGLLLPGRAAAAAPPDGDSTGAPGAVTIVFHGVDELDNVILADMPDVTSHAARVEGDICMSLLPWFDRLIVLVDHERWFDRRSVGALGRESGGLGQQRWAVFNRTQEGELSGKDRMALSRQAERLGATGMTVLDFQRGRGLRRLSVDMMGPMVAFLAGTPPDRGAPLATHIARAAEEVLRQNRHRAEALHELRENLSAAVVRCVPMTRECITALMTPQERRQTEFIARVLHLHGTKQWLVSQARRIRHAVHQVPVVGSLVGPTLREGEAENDEAPDRAAIADSFFEACARRAVNEITQVVESSRFWNDIRRESAVSPPRHHFAWTPDLRGRVRMAADEFDAALREWISAVDGQCQGLRPTLKGAVGASTIALAVVLIAAPGPFAALTLISAKTAIGGALAELLTAAGTGALLGKPVGRLAATLQEKLLGSPQLRQVHVAAERFRSGLELHARLVRSAAEAEAAGLVLRDNDPLHTALEVATKPPPTQTRVQGRSTTRNAQ